MLQNSCKSATTTPSTRSGTAVPVDLFLQLKSFHLVQNISGPLTKVGLVVSNFAALEDRHAATIIFREGAFFPVWITPGALMSHPGPASYPVVDILPYAGEFEPPFGEELHDAAVSVH